MGYKIHFKVFVLINVLIFTSVYTEKIPISPNELLQASNFQIIAPYIYGTFCKKNIQGDWGYRLYTEYLKALCLHDTGIALKEEEIPAFIDQFDTILNQVESSTSEIFDSADVIIDGNKTILNGYEQVAACLLHGKKIMCEVQQVEIKKKDISHDLKQAGLAQKYLDAMASEYIKLNTQTRIAVVWPPGIARFNKIKQMLSEEVRVVYEKRFELKNNGPLIFFQHIPDKIPFINQVFHLYFSPDAQEPYRLAIIVFETEKTLEEVLNLKRKIRKVVGGWRAIHTYDMYEQTIEATRMMLNDNSIHFMNYSVKNEFYNFYTLFYEYKQGLPSHLLKVENFCIDSDGVLALYGIRDVKNLSFIQFDPEELCLISPNIINNNATYTQMINKDTVIFNPENFFYYQNMKFASIDWLKKMAGLRNEEKGLQMSKLIDDHLSAMDDKRVDLS